MPRNIEGTTPLRAHFIFPRGTCSSNVSLDPDLVYLCNATPPLLTDANVARTIIWSSRQCNSNRFHKRAIRYASHDQPQWHFQRVSPLISASCHFKDALPSATSRCNLVTPRQKHSPWLCLQLKTQMVSAKLNSTTVSFPAAENKLVGFSYMSMFVSH